MDIVLEIMDSFYEDDQLVIVGLVFQKICVNNTLHVADQTYIVRDIIYFTKSIDCMDRGMTAKFVVDSHSDYVPENEKYAYMEV